MIPTLILSPRYSDDSITLRRAAIALGWDVMRLAGWRPPEDFAPDEPVLHAEPLFAEAVAERLGLSVVEPPEDFLIRLPDRYLGRRLRLMTAAEARGLAGPAFLKPPNRKIFSPRVYASGADLPDMPDDDPVLASEPVEWEAEFRCFIRDRRLRAWSPYWLGGALAREGDDWIVEPDAWAATGAMVDRLLADPALDLPAAFVLDAGVVRGVGPAVVEANSASGSGLYGCDPSEVLDVLRAAVVPAA
ncbi:ATP-grasp domain-containing protein [Paludisphaera mucosa]|uniref:ATP-grasp domain-containing protein n=1 Tax=Paludisphaera mucosa TaxID=3030827 RepID=A0ABT6FAC4_9BACT|nr:ATP-grasp domain-containing protein [Paludisphaera mucosa]MDG3004330.1 ATP-grasp domain-containing protein [Paludisphaera mucosa]